MRHHRLDVHQHLVIGDVRRGGEAGEEVRVEVQDREGGRHWITFRFPDGEGAFSHLETMRLWQRRGTPLTYVRGAHGGALLDDEELFRLAYEAV